MEVEDDGVYTAYLESVEDVEYLSVEEEYLESVEDEEYLEVSLEYFDVSVDELPYLEVVSVADAVVVLLGESYLDVAVEEEGVVTEEEYLEEVSVDDLVESLPYFEVVEGELTDEEEE